MLYSKKRMNKVIIVLITLMMAMLNACQSSSGDEFTVENNQINENSVREPKIKITTADMNTDETDAIQVILDEHKESCVITEAGTYILSGEYDEQIKVDAEEQIVHLIFDGLTIDTSLGAAVNVVSAGKVIITLKDGTVNTLVDSALYKDTVEEDACIYSESDLTINGNGTLEVYGYYKDAIHSKDVLKLLGGNIFVKSKRDGIHGNDGIVINCSLLSVQSERNGLYSTKSGKEPKGNIEVYGGEYSFIAGESAVSCAADLYVADCALYALGVVADFKANGTSYIDERSLSNE